MRKNHVDFESFKIIIRWNDIFFIGTFFELLKFMERFFFFFFFQKYFVFQIFWLSFWRIPRDTFDEREREALRNVKWINLKWWSVLKAPFNWLLASPNDVGGRKGQGLERNIGCVEQLNDGLMEFRYCLFLTLH